MNAMPMRRGNREQAFTLVELLVSMSLLILIVLFVAQLTSQTDKIWRGSNAKIQSFQEARAGYESMTRKLAQATLQTYYDYYDSAHKSPGQLNSTQLATFSPVTYDRNSDLHFISGQAATLLKNSPTAVLTQTHALFFQAPLGYSTPDALPGQTDAYKGLDSALNACGYYLSFDDASSNVPNHVKNTPGYKSRYRYRLMEMTQSTEKLGIYDPTVRTQWINNNDWTVRNDWFVKNAVNTTASPTNSRVIAENVIALVVLPKMAPYQDDATKAGQGVSLAPNYNYNSRVPVAGATDPGWPSAMPAFPPDQFTAYPATGSSILSSRHHQLPPTVRVIMIVIDEVSALKLQGTATTRPKAIDLTQTTLFTDATKLDADVLAVESICNAAPGNATGNTLKLNYRTFTSDIIMRDARWSNN